LLIAALLALPAQETSEAADGRIRIGIATFESKVREIGDRQAAIITDIFSNTLYNSKRIQLVERERIDDIIDEILGGDTGIYDPETVAEIGRLSGIQYLVTGSVTELNKKASGGGVPIPVFGGATIGSAQTEATAKIILRVIEVETGEVVLSLSESGRSTNSATALSIGGVRWAEGEFGGIEARAIGDAALRLSHKIRERIAGDYSYVIEAGAKEFMIDEGETRAVEPGLLFLVYSDGKTLTDMEGNAIGKKRIPLAVLKVTRTDFDVSYCGVADGTSASVIRRGDKIEPISGVESGKMVKDKVFPSKRPEGLSGSRTDEILKETGSGDDARGEVSAAGKQEPETELVSDSSTVRSQPDPEPAARPGSYGMRPVDGVDPDRTTDAKLIDAYDFISPVERNNLGVLQRGAWNMYSGKKYKEAFEVFTKLADDYPGNYLSAYWAGMAAVKLGSGKEAAGWFEKALSINPNYQPAVDERAKLGDNPVNAPAKKKKGK
jgi:curli biogenesis system outer membrane secretion channel CsgG/TolA-binding protein